MSPNWQVRAAEHSKPGFRGSTAPLRWSGGLVDTPSGRQEDGYECWALVAATPLISADAWGEIGCRRVGSAPGNSVGKYGMTGKGWKQAI